jgi:hypothetical protein
MVEVLTVFHVFPNFLQYISGHFRAQPPHFIFHYYPFFRGGGGGHPVAKFYMPEGSGIESLWGP